MSTQHMVSGHDERICIEVTVPRVRRQMQGVGRRSRVLAASKAAHSMVRFLYYISRLHVPQESIRQNTDGYEGQVSRIPGFNSAVVCKQDLAAMSMRAKRQQASNAKKGTSLKPQPSQPCPRRPSGSQYSAHRPSCRCRPSSPPRHHRCSSQ